jgi:hypothetical protein
MPPHDNDDIKQVEADHGEALPQVQLAVGQEHHGETDGGDEKDDIPDKGALADLELAHQGHGAGDNGGDEAGSTDQLADGHAPAVGAHGGEGAEDVRGAIAKGQEGDAGQALAQAQHAGDGAEVDTEEVAGGDADGGEQQAQPKREDGEGEGLRSPQGAVVEGEVVDQAGLVILAVGQDEGALVGGMVHLTAVDVGRVHVSPSWVAMISGARRGYGLEQRKGSEQGDETGRSNGRPGAVSGPRHWARRRRHCLSGAWREQASTIRDGKGWP